MCVDPFIDKLTDADDFSTVFVDVADCIEFKRIAEADVDSICPVTE